jgi:predicted RNA binding protein YcfA (HicA-like mRNA interferase family)
VRCFVGQALPAVTGSELKSLLLRDGWVVHRQGKHGPILKKQIDGIWRTTQIPSKWSNEAIPDGTLQAILGVRQTALGRAGLIRLKSSA